MPIPSFEKSYYSRIVGDYLGHIHIDSASFNGSKEPPVNSIMVLSSSYEHLEVLF